MNFTDYTESMTDPLVWDISITERDLADGLCGNEKECPITLAIQRSGYWHEGEIVVTLNEILCANSTGIPAIYAKLPPIAMEFRLAYQEEQPLRPIRFTAVPTIIEE